MAFVERTVDNFVAEDIPVVVVANIPEVVPVAALVNVDLMKTVD